VGEPGIIRRPWKPEHAGSNPAIQTASGRASQLARWHPVGSRARRKPLQVRVLSLPFSHNECVRGRAAEAPTCRVGQAGATPAGHSWLSGRSGISSMFGGWHAFAAHSNRVAYRWTGGRRKHGAPRQAWKWFLNSSLRALGRRWCGTCLSPRRDGFESRPGRFFRAEAERRGNRLIRGAGQVRLLPARPWGMDWRWFQRGLMSPAGRFDSGFPDCCGTGLEVLRPHAALVSAEDRVRSPAGPLQPPGPPGRHGAIPFFPPRPRW
jgi:hypothetical protein